MYLIRIIYFRPVPHIMPKIPESETAGVNMTMLERAENDEIGKIHDDDDQRSKPMFLFSVDYILNRAGETNAENDTEKQNSLHYDWLYCTRFKPPKLDSKYYICF